jgi:uncharacterized protein
MNGEVLRRPGVPEVLVAAAIYALIYAAIPPLLNAATAHDDVAGGLAFAALSGLMALAAFVVAVLVRIRDVRAFGVRTVPARWWFVAIGLGVLAFIVVRVLGVAITAVIGDSGGDVQGSYRDAATGGPLALVLQLLFLAVLTPIGEEAAFRGVLTNALGCYGPVVAVLVSTVVFAFAHGVDFAMLPALVVGTINGILFERTRSIWPGVVVHAINNGATAMLPVLLGGAAG